MCLGIPGQIVAINDASAKLATVDVLGVRREINIACVMGADERAQDCIGAWVLVHVGFAMSRIDEREAALTLDLLHALGEAQAEIRNMQASTERASAPSQSAPEPPQDRPPADARVPVAIGGGA